MKPDTLLLNGVLDKKGFGGGGARIPSATTVADMK